MKLKGKPIQAYRVHSGALDELTTRQSTWQVFVVVFQTRAHSPHVPSSHLASTITGFSCHKKVNENLRPSSSPSVLSICGRMYRRKLSERRLRLICDRHYLLL